MNLCMYKRGNENNEEKGKTLKLHKIYENYLSTKYYAQVMNQL